MQSTRRHADRTSFITHYMWNPNFFSQRMENFIGDSTVQWSRDAKLLANEVWSEVRLTRLFAAERQPSSRNFGSTVRRFHPSFALRNSQSGILLYGQSSQSAAVL